VASEAAPKKIKKLGKRGRKRRYEEYGIEDIEPVKEVILFRYSTGRHWPGMSEEMQEWYEFYYFTKPKRAERTKNAEDYERHIRSWERGQKWIVAESSPSLADSGKIVAIRKRAD